MKPFYQSKTLWVNVLTLVAALLNGQYGVLPITAEQSLIALSIVNVILRFLTAVPLGKA